MKNKNLGFVAAVIFTAIALVAMPQAQAQSSMTGTAVSPAQVYDQLLSSIEREMVPLAEAMPADKYNFAPTNGNFKGVRTFGEQVSHVAHGNYMLFSAIAGTPPPSMPKAGETQNKEQLVQQLKDSFAFAHQALSKMTAENAFEPIKPMFRVNTRAGMATTGLMDLNDHFGQMVEYLRMNGQVPPSSMPRPRPSMPSSK